MGSAGVALMILGFGSLILPHVNIQFTVLQWADPYQPWIGVVVGVIGVLLLVGNIMANKNKETPPPYQQ
ncbi:MAG: hypothetical protein Q4D89_08300 [Arachnia propionica]|uniref:hypothetical protein n=1 Tax=Arachnia propionica TaxID=1750 RepID=UPI0026F7EFFA|nr:hypothetical protein [Arachnia propionica]